MKSLRTLTIAGFLLLMGLLPVMAQTISAADAKNHIGEQATVCGVVASEKTAVSSRGEPTFINLDAAYPNQVFTILVWGDDRQNVGQLPRTGSHICATGLIKDYRGVPEIVVRSSGQFSR
jgi:DNA/RNA endonuclease YhcR with UshA esterase domain